MTQPSFGTKITVDEAIKAGKRKVYWPALAIFLGGLSLFFPMLPYGHLQPGLLFCIAFGTGALAAWAWWGYHIVKWRFWAVSSVQDLQKLEAKALDNDLIRNGLHEIGKLEIANAETRTRYKWWYEKYLANAADEQKSDRLLPKQIVLHYSWWSQTSMILVALVGFSVVSITLKDPANSKISMFVFGLGMLALAGYDLFLFSRKKASLSHALKITDRSIQFEEEPPVWWEKVHMAVTIKEGRKYPKYYIQIHTDDDVLKWDVTELNISQDKLDHYLDVFRTRALQSAQI